MSEPLESGRFLRILTGIDPYIYKGPLRWADLSLKGPKVVARLHDLAGSREQPVAITLTRSMELCSHTGDVSAYRQGARLNFLRPGKPVENRFFESFKAG